jgi:penicillin-binding protein 1A
MERGFSPCDETRNVEQTLFDDLGRVWKPRNSGRERYGEMVTLRWGLAKSNNWISAYLMNQLSPYSLKKLIHEFGLTNQSIEATQSLCLGSCDASVSEMVSAYTAFVGKGMRVAPLMVTRIEDNAGNVIATFSAHRNEVISRESSYKMIEMMRGVINEGTGYRIRGVYGMTADMCGKTGTTQNMSDGWFVGYTPSLVTGCWVGGEERNIHFDRMSEGQGAAMALPIFGLYMQKVYKDKALPYNQEEVFDIPEDFDPCRSKFQIVDDEEEDDGEEVSDGDEEPVPVVSYDSEEDEQQEGFDDLFE